MLGVDLGIAILIASFCLIISSYAFIRYLLPGLLFVVLANFAEHVVTTYAPELGPSSDNAVGRPQEGLLGNPLVQRILTIVIDKIQGSGAGGSTQSYQPGLK